MKKLNKLIVLVLAVVMITAAFAPAALAAASEHWSSWPQQGDGSHNNYVIAIQRYCRERVAASLTMDGVYGPNTVYAVKALQSSLNISADGIVGANTWTAMRNKLAYVGGTSMNDTFAVRHQSTDAPKTTNSYVWYFAPLSQWRANTSTVEGGYSWTTILQIEFTGF